MITGFSPQWSCFSRRAIALTAFIGLAAVSSKAAAETAEIKHLNVHISFGHQSPESRLITPQLVPGSPGLVAATAASTLEAGAGQIASMIANVSWPKPTEPSREIHSIWQYLLENGEAGQVARLLNDPGLQPGAPVLTVQLSNDGTDGFSIGLDQLLRHRAMWLPEQDAFVTLADAPMTFDQHVSSLNGSRVRDQVARAPEATLADWTDRWLDFGDPVAWNKPWETSWLGTRGHLTAFVARHGSLYKFAVDRWTAVRPDFASPHRFRLDPLWKDAAWAGQQIVDGLPILVTRLSREGQSCAIEQFATALSNGDPHARGEVASVFLTRMRFSGSSRPVEFGFRMATEDEGRTPEVKEIAGRTCIVDRETGHLWLMLESGSRLRVTSSMLNHDNGAPSLELLCTGELGEDGTLDVIAKLCSPTLPQAQASQLALLDYPTARTATVAYWENWLAQGAGFHVPEKAVNDLFRANLWHALTLPRHRTDEHGVDRMDLPYSNLAYGQYNADWPINQAVYVDYMIHGLRGYYAVADEEFAAIYQTQQKENGRVGGYADWGVYSPSMLYSIGQNFLLSNDRGSFERLLPQSFDALDWCLAEIEQGTRNTEAPGVIVAPLNDLTHERRAWAFPNGYFVAGLHVFGRALASYGHPRAVEVRAVSEKMLQDLNRAFARASVRSPVVQLADGTWINYVPGDALTPRRMLDEWYPTDVDTGPLHMSRLGAIDPLGRLTDALLHDNEDNLFLNQWGMANEPVYNQQATAYLRRDEPEAVIRAFYSMMACAFSHHQLTPLEHRWAWGQYYMPPSTDGAWFELYRNMLINELRGDDTLFIGQAIPRAWLRAGRTIRLTRAPTYFGPVNLDLESDAEGQILRAQLAFLDERRPRTLLLRLRHPDKRQIQSVTVNGGGWNNFDAVKEWITIPNPAAERFVIEAHY